MVIEQLQVELMLFEEQISLCSIQDLYLIYFLGIKQKDTAKKDA
jgi:hypothetical protein